MVQKAAEFLLDILGSTEARKEYSFMGLGIIIYKTIENLPISSLTDMSKGENLPISEIGDIKEKLLQYSKIDSPFHDGFHLISSNLELTHISQFFSPPVVDDPKISIGYNHGARYRAAQFGSCIPDIVVTGVLSNNYGAIIFRNGSAHSQLKNQEIDRKID